MRGIGMVILVIIGIGVCTIPFFDNAMASSLEWDSGNLLGILPSEYPPEISLRVSDHSKSSLILHWDSSGLMGAESYKIFRKTLDTDYQEIAVIDYKKNQYVDSGLPTGFYGYKILPIMKQEKSDPITSHGIDRKSNLFPIYKKGQEIIAQHVVKQICYLCLEKSFSEINQTKSIVYPEKIDRLQDPIVQNHLKFEASKAQNLISQLFEIKINH